VAFDVFLRGELRRLERTIAAPDDRERGAVLRAFDGSAEAALALLEPGETSDGTSITSRRAPRPRTRVARSTAPPKSSWCTRHMSGWRPMYRSWNRITGSPRLHRSSSVCLRCASGPVSTRQVPSVGIDEGTDTRLIQGYLGHADIRNTVIYTEMSSKRLASVHVY
jgi:hypothetical protein